MKPTVLEKLNENGGHSHWVLTDGESGNILWSELDDPCRKNQFGLRTSGYMPQIENEASRYATEMGKCMNCQKGASHLSLAFKAGADFLASLIGDSR